jgi:hypothetical protein
MWGKARLQLEGDQGARVVAGRREAVTYRARRLRWRGGQIFAAAFAVACTAGCQVPPSGPGPLPPPPPGPITNSGALPVHPYAKAAGDGYARTLVTAVAPGNVTATVRNLMIRANGQSAISELPGPGLLELVAGTGTLSVDGHESALTGDQLFQLDPHRTATLKNEGDQPLVVRLYLFGVQ